MLDVANGAKESGAEEVKYAPKVQPKKEPLCHHFVSFITLFPNLYYHFTGGDGGIWSLRSCGRVSH